MTYRYTTFIRYIFHSTRLLVLNSNPCPSVSHQLRNFLFSSMQKRITKSPHPIYTWPKKTSFPRCYPNLTAVHALQASYAQAHAPQPHPYFLKFLRFLLPRPRSTTRMIWREKRNIRAFWRRVDLGERDL